MPPSRRNLKRRPSDLDTDAEREDSQRPAKRRPTAYDAVAGRATQWGLNNSSTKSAGQPLRPDEVLYKARNAPTRYEETDHYFAHTKLPEGQTLPSGDLLSALHAYIANFYARSQEQINQKVWRCMDETALLALGILIEESAKEVLGETGDLVFTEAANGEEEEEDESAEEASEGVPGVAQVIEDDEDAEDYEGKSEVGSDVEEDLEEREVSSDYSIFAEES